jgi:hypothetical protein
MGMWYTYFYSVGKYVHIIDLLAFQGIYHVNFYKNFLKNPKKR